MWELFFIWMVGLGMMLGGGFFAFIRLKEVFEQMKKYKDAKKEKKLRWWYAEWPLILLNTFFGELGRPNLIISLIFFLGGTLSFVIYTIRLVASFF